MGVQVLLILDQERGVFQCDVNVRNVLTLSVVKACTGIKGTLYIIWGGVNRLGDSVVKVV